MIKPLWLTIALVFLAPSAYCFSYGASTDGAGYSVQMDASDEESLVAVSALDGGGLSNTISGKGCLHENHFVSGQGATAQVRADLISAENYTYSYELLPGSADAQDVQASETLDVESAAYIRAAATAESPGMYSTASTEVIYGSLSGYSNNAYASADKAVASQSLHRASGAVTADSVSRHVDGGDWKTSRVDTHVQGELTRYNGTATSMIVKDMADYSEVKEDSHIVGWFVSRALDDNGSDIRVSDFGTEFDLSRYAWTGYAAMGGSTGGTNAQGYYVSAAGSIQSAIDLAKDGDTINLAPGTYFENLQIKKNLLVSGADPASTIIDGMKRGSVISITSPCTVSNLQIQNGYAEKGGGVYISVSDGAVTLNNCIISSNKAENGAPGQEVMAPWINKRPISISGAGNGGGIYLSRGSAALGGCKIYGNTASDGGGIYNFMSSLTVQGGTTIYSNTAQGITSGWISVPGHGGGIYSSGNTKIEGGSTVTQNSPDNIYDYSPIIIIKPPNIPEPD